VSATLSGAAKPAPIDPRALDEAAAWLAQLHSGAATETDRAACERWRTSDPEHARAWALAQRLMHKLNGLPPALAMPALTSAPARRAALRKLAVSAVALPAAYMAWRETPWEAWTAEHRTAVGERREVRLADGSRVTLNTATSVDVRFDPQQRVVVLHGGEILVQTAHDSAAAPRPFRVLTPHGSLRALGTRFTVRTGDGCSHVAVLEGTVEIRPRGVGEAGVRELHAGQKTAFGDAAVEEFAPADAAAAAWTHGMLVAHRMRLAEFACELARYRRGVVRCDPAVAQLEVSGAFPIDDTNRSIEMLQTTYAVRAVYRTRYWVTLVAR
jgi:transmembrane sensor